MGTPKLASDKPRLAFFRPCNPSPPPFIRQHLDEHVLCLETFFDVILIEEDCDYDQICGKIQPDLSLFESGVYARAERRIRNTHRHAGIPKIGLLNSDAYCPSRSVFLSDMDEWGVETFFTISMTLRDRAPQLFRDRLFVWPNFADSKRFRTYPGGKQTCIVFAGSHAPHYPWRSRVNRLLSARFPINALPHGGWEATERTTSMISGDAYALALSSALIAPTCGTVANELVRKHLEIPACGAMLLTERTAAVEAAGFVDMETCVFASEEDVVDKVQHLLANPDEIARISANGQALAHARHDLKHRNQIFQWYELNRRANPNETIAQPDPFRNMVLQKCEQSDLLAPQIVSSGRDWALIVAGDDAAEAGKPDTARSKYLAAINYHYEAEAAVGLARLALRGGNATLGKKWVRDSIIRITYQRGAAEPDPVEWSVFILSTLCAGNIHKAVAAARQYHHLTHNELARTRYLVHRLSGAQARQAPDRRRLSIHRDLTVPWAAWIGDVSQMLEACGQTDLSRRAAALSSTADPAEAVSRLGPSVGRRRIGRRSQEVSRHYWSKLGLRSRLRQVRGQLRPQAPAIENPMPSIIGGRRIETIALIGVASDDRVGEWARHACRRSTEPCALVTVGDPPSSDTPLQFIPDRGNDAFGSGRLLPIPLNDQSMAIVGTAAATHWPCEAFKNAMLVVLTNANMDTAQAFAIDFNSDGAWRQIDLPEQILALGVAAWERNQ
ncbi:MAG: glycosyltransferase [Hyphomonadaceae bacterium]|nr:glycosyltransferase [Hyphomonadaceae bacterium]